MIFKSILAGAVGLAAGLQFTAPAISQETV